MENSGRREFLRVAASGLAAAGAAGLSNAANTEGKPVHITARDYLAGILYTRQEVDDWFDGKAFPFSKHDPELGWLLPDARFADGLDGSVSTYRYEENNGPRKLINYTGQPCRIPALPPWSAHTPSPCYVRQIAGPVWGGVRV